MDWFIYENIQNNETNRTKTLDNFSRTNLKNTGIPLFPYDFIIKFNFTI